MKRLLLVFLLSPMVEAASTWSSSAGAGLAITSGNSDTRSINLSLNTAFDSKKGHVFKVDALYLQGEKDGARQLDKTTINVRYERRLENRAFWFGEAGYLRDLYLRDPFRETDYLITPVAGAGYHAIREERRKLTFDGALGGALEDDDTSAALKGGQSFDWAISKTSRFSQRLTGLWKTNDFADALYHFDAAVATAVSRRVELKVSYLYDYKNRPPSRGVQKADSSLFAALHFKF